ncbi:hypothetical protein CDL12_20328 [Handroanthus impetiginosus]|uniref:Late nodulin n=1 Tax=Handroanthus impetiginosus TaxID=429701 RepID=A0A2G9GPH4_9LAMI|nr:hypothetical protein CDL12_20328 [Handroanthus impetiginosus]
MATMKMVFLSIILLVLFGTQLISAAIFRRCNTDADCNPPLPNSNDCKEKVCLNTYCFCKQGGLSQKALTNEGRKEGENEGDFEKKFFP